MGCSFSLLIKNTQHGRGASAATAAAAAEADPHLLSTSCTEPVQVVPSLRGSSEFMDLLPSPLNPPSFCAHANLQTALRSFRECHDGTDISLAPGSTAGSADSMHRHRIASTYRNLPDPARLGRDRGCH